MEDYRWVPADTSPEAHRLQGQILRKMSGAERVAIAFELSETVRRLTMAGIRSRHPEYTDRQVFLAFARLKLGDDLTSAVWPAEELVVP